MTLTLKNAKKKSVNVTLIVFIMKWNIVFHFLFLHYLSEPTKLASTILKGYKQE